VGEVGRASHCADRRGFEQIEKRGGKGWEEIRRAWISYSFITHSFSTFY
jgi:hypothetical protein